jgi:hypothetical protein
MLFCQPGHTIVCGAHLSTAHVRYEDAEFIRFPTYLSFLDSSTPRTADYCIYFALCTGSKVAICSSALHLVSANIDNPIVPTLHRSFQNQLQQLTHSRHARVISSVTNCLPFSTSSANPETSSDQRNPSDLRAGLPHMHRRITASRRRLDLALPPPSLLR